MLTKKHQAACLRAMLIALFAAFGLVPCLSQPVAGSGSKLNEYTRLERRNWKHAPLTKNSLKAAQAMDRVLKEFKAVKTKKEEQAILRRYMRDSYSTAIQTAEALYAAFFFGSKYRIRLSLDQEPFAGASSKELKAAYAAHVRLADPSVIEYAKAAVLIDSSERSFPLPKQTVQSVYKLFKNDPHSWWLLSVYEVSLEFEDKQNRLALYTEVRSLYNSFTNKLVYLHCSDVNNSKIQLNLFLMLFALRLQRYCGVTWGIKAAIRHYTDLVDYKTTDDQTKKTQARAKYLRTRLGF